MSKKFFKSNKKRITGPKVSHTKGYYRFSKEFPSVTDSEGYRDNDIIINSPEKRTAVRRRLAFLFVCIFVISFCATALCVSISKLPVQETNEELSTQTESVPAVTLDKVLAFSGEVLSYSNCEGIISECRSTGATAVIIDFKDAQGYFYFKPSVSLSAEALSTVAENPRTIIEQLQSEGISVYASVSCFADDIYARNNQGITAYVTSVDDLRNETQSIWYAGENGSNAWLSPFSNEVCYYLTTVIGDVAALGVDGIVFDNVALPVSAEEDNVRFALSSEYEVSVQEKIANWLSYTISTVSCDTAFTISAAQLLSDYSKEEIPAYYSSGCDYILFDVRPSDAQKGVAIDGLQYLEPEKTPGEYITAVLTAGFEFFSANEIDSKIITVLDDNSSLDIQLSAVSQFDVKSIIL